MTFSEHGNVDRYRAVVLLYDVLIALILPIFVTKGSAKGDEPLVLYMHVKACHSLLFVAFIFYIVAPVVG